MGAEKAGTAIGLWTFLDLDCPDGDYCQKEVKVRLTINSNRKIFQITHITYTPYTSATAVKSLTGEVNNTDNAVAMQCCYRKP